jgi:hypothetical protein
MSTSSDTAFSSGENVIPKFPDRKEDFDEYRMVMQAYLDARGLWSSVNVVSSVASLSKDVQEASESSSSSSTGDDKSKTPVTDEKAKRAFAILLQSFKRKQLLMVKQITPGDAASVWKKICSVYGTVKSTETQVSLLDQLKYMKKTTKETIEDYLARVDRIIYDLKTLGEVVSDTQRKYYILEGLIGLEEWQLDVKLIKKLDKDNKWSQDELEQYLVSNENSMNLKKLNNVSDTEVENAYTF